MIIVFFFLSAKTTIVECLQQHNGGCSEDETYEAVTNFASFMLTQGLFGNKEISSALHFDNALTLLTCEAFVTGMLNKQGFSTMYFEMLLKLQLNLEYFNI